MKSKSIATAYQQVKKFNEIASVLDNPTIETVDLYNSLGFEELSESIAALEENNPIEILDGALDEFYIICGKLQILERLGYNVEEGLKRVCDNNLTKFPTTENNTTNTWNSDWTATNNKKYKVMVFKNQAGKIMKPHGFKSVDISDCVPKEVV